MTASGGAAATWQRLRPALIPVLALAVAVAATWPSPRTLLAYWHDIPDYQHGFLLAALSVGWLALLLWRGAAREARPGKWVSAALAMVMLAWIVAARSGFDIAHELLWPVALLLSVWATCGRGVALRLAAPIGLLYFAIPVWDYGLPILQRLSIFFSEGILQLLGVPATVTEYRVTIPEGTFEIVEGCSGKRYFIVTLAVAYLGVAINHVRGWRIAAYLGAAALLAMFTNWLRIVIVIYAGHLTNMQHYMVAVEHNTQGQIMFVVLLVLVLWLGRRLGASPDATAPRSVAAGPHAKGDAVRAGMAGWQLLPPVAIMVAVVLLRGTGPGRAPAALGHLPLATGYWQGPLPPGSGWSPRYELADAERRAAYSSTQGSVELYINVYGEQGNGRELIHYRNSLIAPALWTQPWGGHTETFRVGADDLALRYMRGPDQRRWLVAYRYVVAGRSIRQDTIAKLAYGWYSLFGPAPAGIIAIASACEEPNCDHARARLAGFWENAGPPIRAMMPAGAGSKP